MLSLKSLREVGEKMEREEARLRKENSVEQRVNLFLGLYRASLPFFDETRDLFLPEREHYLKELQSKLQTLERWRQKQYAAQPKSI